MTPVQLVSGTQKGIALKVPRSNILKVFSHSFDFISAIETDSAQVLSYRKRPSLTAAIETDAAQDFTGEGDITHLQSRHLPPRVRGIPSKFLQWRS